jgi:hypothetical protein
VAAFLLPGGFVLLFMGFLWPVIPAGGSEDRSPIVLRASTTVERDTTVTALTFDSPRTGIPVDFGIELISSGGLIGVQLVGDMVCSWDSLDVVPGGTFDLAIDFEPGGTTVGEVRAKYGYFVQPFYRIDYDALFHDLGSPFEFVIPSYPFTGATTAKFPWTSDLGSVADRSIYALAGADSLFLLGDSLRSAADWDDTLTFQYSVKPSPCLNLRAQGSIRTSLSFWAAMDSLCVRYAPETDTLCWAAQAGFQCQASLASGWNIPVPVPCRGAGHVVVPVCPIRGNGKAAIEIKTEVKLDSLLVTYTCWPVPVVLPGTGVTDDTTWVVQEVSFGTDRDDRIFEVPVQFDSLAITIRDGLNTVLGNKDTLTVDSLYVITWGALDDSLEGCCENDSLRLIYRDVDNWGASPPAPPCFGEIADQDSTGAGSGVSWTVPNDSGFDGRNFKILLEIFCPATGELLYYTATDTLIIVGGISGG